MCRLAFQTAHGVCLLLWGPYMATRGLSEVVQHLRRVVLVRDGAGLSDGQLLEAFVVQRDDACLAALVRRHASMVWGVCRRLLHNHHDAEDAFQATFLVLVRRAAQVVPRDMVANWLYGVAHQTALKTRATAAKRSARERQVIDMPEPQAVDSDSLERSAAAPRPGTGAFAGQVSLGHCLVRPGGQNTQASG